MLQETIDALAEKRDALRVQAAEAAEQPDHDEMMTAMFGEQIGIYSDLVEEQRGRRRHLLRSLATPAELARQGWRDCCGALGGLFEDVLNFKFSGDISENFCA